MTFTGELFPFQVEAKDMMVGRKALLLAHGLGMGKEQPNSEPVLTPCGWVLMGDIRPGDAVIGVDGAPTEVLSVHPQGTKDVVRVTFSDGSWTECGWNHLWTVKVMGKSTTYTISTRQMVMGAVLETKKRGRTYYRSAHYKSASGQRKFSIPMLSGPVQFAPVDLPLDPYVLGVWLGDGTSRVGAVTTMDVEVVAAISNAGFPVHRVETGRSGRASTYFFNGLSSALSAIGEISFVGPSNKRKSLKHVPSTYLRSSTTQRLALLQGLMDSDGSPLTAGGGTEFSSTNENLVDAVVDLFQSLGGVARKKGPRVTWCSVDGERRPGKPSWRVNGKLPQGLVPFRLQRKLDKWVPPTKYFPQRYIENIEPVGRSERSTCIQVANADGLYVTRNYIVTHNTVTSIAACEELIDSGEAQSVLVVCPASVKWQWKHQIDKFTDGALVKIIEGDKGQGRVQHHAVKRGTTEYVIMNYEQVVADWDIIRYLPFDIVVCDEVVAIKNPGTKRSRHIKRLQTGYRFGLSGQPIENRPEELFSIMQWIDPDVLGSAQKFDRAFIVRNAWGSPQHYMNLPLLRETMQTAMHRRTRNDVRDQMPAVVQQSHYIDFDKKGADVYRRIVNELIDVIRAAPKYGSFNVMNHYGGAGDDGGPMGEIMPRLMALRMLCDHPALLSYSADKFDDPDAVAGSQYISDARLSGVLDGLDKSPKLTYTLEVIAEILEADPRNKVVLFSFFKPMLAIIGEHLSSRFALFTGDQTPRERDAAVTEFTTNPECRVLLSSDAGGIGVDIPVANYLISYDLPWSAGKFEQRNGRIIRISSKWPEVTLISMLMRNSMEERMLQMLEEKVAIGAAWLDNEGLDESGSYSLTLGSLVDFLDSKI